MKDLKHNQLLQSRSGKKGAVIDIDIIIAYLIFISTIVLMTNYTLRLTAPFSTSIESIEKEKNTLTIRELIETKFSVNGFSDLCSINYLNLRRLSINYEIKGFRMPFIDSSNFSPNSINGSVVFKRDSNSLIVKTGSEDLEKEINTQIIIPNAASVTNLSLESSDSFTINLDSFNNLIVDFNSIVSDGDIDEIVIKPIKGIVSFWINGVDLSDCYIGELPISDYCGTRGIVGPQTSFSRYGLMTDSYSNYYVKLTGDIWWTS